MDKDNSIEKSDLKEFENLWYHSAMKQNSYPLNFLYKLKQNAGDASVEEFMKVISAYASAEHSLKDTACAIRERLNPYPEALDEFCKFLPAEARLFFQEKLEQNDHEAGVTMGSQHGMLDSGSDFQVSEKQEMVIEENGDKEHPESAEERRTFVPYRSVVLQPRFLTSKKYSKALPESFAHDSKVSKISTYGNYEYIQFFNKVESVLKPKPVFNNFLRILHLQQDGYITVTEMIKAVTPFLAEFPMLFKELKDFYDYDRIEFIEEISYHVVNRIQLSPDDEMDLDYYHTKKLGASYKPVKTITKEGQSSLKPDLCKEVINNTWVAFPPWTGEDFQASKKTDSQKNMLHTEEERFELDFAIKSNMMTIKHLESIQTRLDDASPAERYAIRLDRTLNSGSVLHERNIRRIYGERAGDVINGLMNNPTVAVPIVLKRLKIRDDEWSRAYASFDEYWKTQIDKHSLKSLDSKSANFKSSDVKRLRHKQLLSEIKTIYHQKQRIVNEEAVGSYSGPHLTHIFEFCVIEDAVSLIKRHSVKYSSKNDKKNINLLLYFVSEFFDISRDYGHEKEQEHTVPCKNIEEEDTEGSKSKKKISQRRKRRKSKQKTKKKFLDKKESLQTAIPYVLFFATDVWYLFFRLFHCLCERLNMLKMESKKMHISSVDKNEDEISTHSSPYDRLYVRLLTGKQELSEEEARQLFGTLGYLCLSLDRITVNIAKILYQINVEELSRKCILLYKKYVGMIQTQPFGCFSQIIPFITKLDNEYCKRAQEKFGDENCYKVIWHKEYVGLSIELMPPILRPQVSGPTDIDLWQAYIDKFEDPWEMYIDHSKLLLSSTVIMTRNLRKQIKFWRKKFTIRQEIFYNSSTKYQAKSTDQTKISFADDRTSTLSSETIPSICEEASFNKQVVKIVKDNEQTIVLDESSIPENVCDEDIVIVSSVNAEFNENVSYSVNNVLALPIATQVTVTCDESFEKDEKTNLDIIKQDSQTTEQSTQIMESQESGEFSEDTKNMSSVSNKKQITDENVESVDSKKEIRRYSSKLTKKNKKSDSKRESIDTKDKSIKNDSLVTCNNKLVSLNMAAPEIRVCRNYAMKSCTIIENSAYKLDNKTYKLRYVRFTGDFFYRPNSFYKAKQEHKKHCLKQRDKFFKWHERWIQENTTPDMLNHYTKWLYKSDHQKYSIACETVIATSKPPYATYEKYHVVYPTRTNKRKRTVSE